MTRRIQPGEALALNSARDEARGIVGDLFPGLRIAMSIATGEDGRGIAAHFVDPAPRHNAQDVLECLSELGVRAAMVTPRELKAQFGA